MTYDSGNPYLDKLHELIEDAETNYKDYNSWEEDFLDSLENSMFELEVGDLELSEKQKDKIEEMYCEHLED